MKSHYNKRYLQRSIYLLIVIILSIMFYKFMDNMNEEYLNFYMKVLSIRKVLKPFIIGIFIAYILNPLVRWIEANIFKKVFSNTRIKKFSWFISTIVVYIMLISLMTLTILHIVPRIINNLTELMSSLPLFIHENETRILHWINAFYANDIYNIAATIEKNINEIFLSAGELLQKSLNNIVASILAFTSSMVNLILGLFISFYFLMDKTILLKSAEKILRAIFADQKVNNLKRFCKKADSIFGKFIVGKAIDSLIIGGICFIGLIILKIRYPLLISIIVVVTNMIPYFGPIIGAAIAFVITSFYNPIQGLWVLIFVFLLQQFDGMILGPAILGDKVGVRPLWIIFSVALGGSLFGVIGMFLGVPAIATIRVLIVYFVNRKMEEKENKIQK